MNGSDWFWLIACGILINGGKVLMIRNGNDPTSKTWQLSGPPGMAVDFAVERPNNASVSQILCGRPFESSFACKK